eukprot:SAG31_NODE_3764_length_3904_cov_1.346386_4_plen_30_part_00
MPNKHVNVSRQSIHMYVTVIILAEYVMDN